MPRLCVTTGEPAGIGPELMFHLTGLKTGCELVLIGDRDLIHARMAVYPAGRTVHLPDFDPGRSRPVSILHTPLTVPSIPGTMDARNARYVLNTLDLAIDGCMSGLFCGMVTAPISKSVICSLGVPFTGHTEYLQQRSHTDEVVMMLGCRELNVALVTTHLPLSAVPQAITRAKLRRVIEILHHDLKSRMGIAAPKIYVCVLHPHAGEDGTLGREEIETIIPCLEELRQEGLNLIGPLPADTIFQQKYLDDASAILTMYHDQGLPVLKYIGFDHGFNTTLGLPFIRTSVDHGTALDLAGTGCCDPGSLLTALDLALHMAGQAGSD